MDGQQLFELWLSLLTLVLGGIGVVLWYFVRKVIEIPTMYATKGDVERVEKSWKEDLRQTSDDWKNEVRAMREERRQDNKDMQSKLDKIDNAIASVHKRIDAIFQQQANNG